MTLIRCDHCNTPIMEVKGREIVVRVKHSGKQHITVVRIGDLMDRDEQSAPDDNVHEVRRI